MASYVLYKHFFSFIKGKQISPKYFPELSPGKVGREGEVKLVKELFPRRQEIVRRNFELFSLLKMLLKRKERRNKRGKRKEGRKFFPLEVCRLGSSYSSSLN